MHVCGCGEREIVREKDQREIVCMCERESEREEWGEEAERGGRGEGRGGRERLVNVNVSKKSGAEEVITDPY